MTGKIFGLPLVFIVLVLLIVLPLGFGLIAIGDLISRGNQTQQANQVVLYRIMKNTTPIVVTPTPEEVPTPTLKQGVRSSATSSGVIKK